MSRRCIIHTSSPSRSSATEGDEGGYGAKYSRARVGRLDVGAGKHRGHDVGPLRVLQRHRDARPRLAGRATANRVHDDHDRAARLHRLVDVGRRAQLARTNLVSSARIGAMNCSGYAMGTF